MKVGGKKNNKRKKRLMNMKEKGKIGVSWRTENKGLTSMERYSMYSLFTPESLLGRG